MVKMSIKEQNCFFHLSFFYNNSSSKLGLPNQAVNTRIMLCLDQKVDSDKAIIV